MINGGVKYHTCVSLLLLALFSPVRGQELKVDGVYVHGGPHSTDYAVFRNDGRFRLIRSGKLTYEQAQNERGPVMKARYSIDDNGNIVFKVDKDFPARLIPVRAKVNGDGSLTVNYRMLGWPKNREQARTYYLDDSR